MQEINLLQNKLKDRTESFDRRNSVIVVVLGFITIGVLVLGGFFYFLNDQAKSNINDVLSENAQIQTKLDSNQGDLANAKSFQAQLKNIESLSASHIYWSEVFDQIQQTALKQSQYLLLSAKTDGKMHLEGITSSYTDLGKLILALSGNPNVKEVKLLAATRSTDLKAGFNYSLDVSINQSILTKK